MSAHVQKPNSRRIFRAFVSARQTERIRVAISPWASFLLAGRRLTLQTVGGTAEGAMGRSRSAPHPMYFILIENNFVKYLEGSVGSSCCHAAVATHQLLQESPRNAYRALLSIAPRLASYRWGHTLLLVNLYSINMS